MATTEQIAQVEKYLRVGAPVFLDVNPAEKNKKRFHSNLHGWDLGQFLLIHQPDDLDNDLLEENLPCALSVLQDGDLVGFATRLIFQPNQTTGKMLQLAWPASARRMHMRKHDCVTISGKCDIQTEDGKTHTASLDDISIGGCGISSMFEAEVNDSVLLSFSLPEGPTVSGIFADICNKKINENQLYQYGCIFTNSNQIKEHGLELYIGSRLAQECGLKRTNSLVLMLSQDDEDYTHARQVLNNVNCELLVAKDFVKACQSLGKNPPTALIIRYNFPAITGSQAASLIHRSPGLEKLPIVVYGSASIGASASETDNLHSALSLPQAVDWISANALK